MLFPEPMLRDCDFGDWAGLSLDEVQQSSPEAVAKWLQEPGAAPHGGESTLALIERVAQWLDGMQKTSGRRGRRDPRFSHSRRDHSRNRSAG